MVFWQLHQIETELPNGAITSHSWAKRGFSRVSNIFQYDVLLGWKRQGAEYFNHFNFRILLRDLSVHYLLYKRCTKNGYKTFFYYLEGFVVLFQGFASIIFILQHFLPFTFVGLRPYYRITCVTLIIIRKKRLTV